ncbi:MAG TPA: ATP-binding protein [Steroidobacteraceae bacterium]|nr:ATP-binding protein [Steroidobacteraceae bacterium]
MELDKLILDESAEDLFEQAPCGYLTTLADGRIVKVNQTFLTWTGYRRDGLVARRRFRDLLTVPGRIYYDTHIAPLLQMQSYVREVAFDIARPAQNAMPVLANFVQKRSADRPPLIRITLFDATDRRQYEKELLLARRAAEQAVETERAAREESDRANRAKDEFLTLVSHELRTPLAAILGWTQILRKNIGSAPQSEQGLDVIERNTRLQVKLVDDLLDMGRIVSGKLRLDVQDVELARVIEAALETAHLAAEARNIRLKVINDPTVIVSGDPGRLQQVFWNLLSNAIKFTPPGGSVQIVMQRVNSHIEVKVIDSGQGMRAELVPHIFERFRQSVSAATQSTNGLGLGLSLVRTLVEMHGGTVEASSAGEGRGSEFIVRLPVAVLRSGAGEERVHPEDVFTASPSRTGPIDLSGIRVLLADDDQDTREIMTKVISKSGAEVLSTASAFEALQAFGSFRPNVLISDIGMPQENGYELIRKVRMLGDGGAVPAIALTAFARLEDRTRAMLAGFQIHLTKPVDATELLVTIANVTGRIAGTRQVQIPGSISQGDYPPERIVP